MRKVKLSGFLFVLLLFAGCFPDTPVLPAPVTATSALTEAVQVTPTPVAPTKEEVLAMREAVREGMDRNDFEQLGERMKEANRWMENAYVYEDLFALLEDENHEYWERDCSGFVEYVSSVAEAVQNEKFRQDLQYILDQIQLAKYYGVLNVYKEE